jgi:hypothetical protein
MVITTVIIDAPPSLVRTVLLDFPNHKSWNPFFKQISGNPI